MLRGNGERVIVDQEKPVAAPGNIADDGAERGLHADLLFPAAGRDVLHRYAAIVVQRCAYVADRGFNQMYAWLDTAKPRQRGDKPDGAVAAHIQKTGVVEENDASGGRRRDRLAQQRADQHIVAARFENHRLTPAIEVTGETVAALRHAAAAEVGKPSTIRRVGSPPVCESMALSAIGGVARSFCSPKVNNMFHHAGATRGGRLEHFRQR